MSVATALARAFRGTCASLAFAAVALLAAGEARAQGVTTGAVRGRVLDQAGQPVPGATLLLVNRENGQRYTGGANAGGTFYVPNVVVGVYSVEARAIGFRPARQPEVQVVLGQQSDVELRLEAAAVEVEGITTVAAADTTELNRSRTGVSSYVSEAMIENLPSLQRNFNDFTRTSSLVNGNSIAGQADRYNALQIDGGSNGDLFGLNGSRGSPGGANDSRPLSVEAVKEFQVLIAPYDVRQGGFTGGLVNAVTRSGTNQFHGAIFGYAQDDALQGKDTAGVAAPEFNRKYYGFSLGGPIIRDRLQFFASAEWRAEDALFNSATGGQVRYISPGDTINFSPTAGLSARTAERLRQYAINSMGFDPGDWGRPSIPNPDRNIFVKLTGQLGSRHQAELAYNNVASNRDVIVHDPFGPNPARIRDGYQFDQSGYHNNSGNHSIRGRLNSQFSNSTTNEVIASIYTINDARKMTNPISLMIIGADSTTGGTPAAHFAMGGERFSQANTLDQNILEISDNLTHSIGNHVLTLGGRIEQFKFKNVFFAGSLGNWYFRDTVQFFAGTPERYERALPGVYADSVHGRTDGPIANFTFRQYGLYFQDQITAARGLTLTLGIRADFTGLPAPTYNERLDTMNVVNGPRAGQDFGIKTNQRPTDATLFSPRFGFNYDVHGDRSLFLRGGLGIFSGRTPYVWASNAYVNTGLEQTQLTCDGAVSATGGTNDLVPAFTFDGANQPTACAGAGGAVALPRAGIVYFDQNFKLPQNFRASVGLDKKLPWDMVGSFDALYTRAINQFALEDVNLVEGGTSVGEGNRKLYGTFGAGSAVVPRRLVTTVANDVLRQFNSNQDYSYALTFQLVKRLQNMEFQAMYTYSRSYDLMSPTSDISNSLLNFSTLDGTMFNRNLTASFFDQPHSVRLSGTVQLPYQFRVSLFYTGQSGRPYAYRYNTDVNADNFSGNDLFYVPLNAQDISLANPAQWTQLDAFINSEPCLREQRGKIMERNSCRNPWRTFLDARVSKTFPTIRSQNVEFTANIYNVLALLGVGGIIRATSTNENIALLNRTGYSTALGRGIYSLLLPPRNVVQYPDSRWKLEFGARYSF